MKFSVAPSLTKRLASDMLVLPFYQSKNKAVAAVALGRLEDEIGAALHSGDFKGEEGASLLVYVDSKKDKRYLLLGLGEIEKPQ